MAGSSPTCPLCRNSFRSLVDKQALRQVQDLRVRCSKKSEGCNWEGEMRALEMHEGECKWIEVVCPYGCGGRFSRNHAQEHYCPKQPLEVRMEGLIHRFNAELVSTKQAHQSELASLRSEFKQELERRDNMYHEKLKQLEKKCAELKGEFYTM